jgi:hypothetical protein
MDATLQWSFLAHGENEALACPQANFIDTLMAQGDRTAGESLSCG